MTDRIIERIAEEYADSFRYTHAEQHVPALQFIRRTLEADLAAHGFPEMAVDVERLFAAIELLIERNAQPWSPFVATWHPVLEGFSSPAPIRAFDFRRVAEGVEKAIRSNIENALKSPHYWGSESISRELDDALQKVVERTRPVDFSIMLRGIRERMLESLYEILRIKNQSDVEYLRPLLSLVERQRSLTVATLNYDRSVETVAETHGTVCDTALDAWLMTGELSLAEEGLRLLKLHGSIDWAIEEAGERGGLPLKAIAKLEALDEGARRWARPAIVFGEAGKLRSEGPYIELLLAWAAQLRETSTLLVVGYSFRDQHINEFIARWFKASERRIVILDRVPPALPPREDEPATIGQPTTLTEHSRVQFVQGTAREQLGQAIDAATAD